jgi:glycosyltransferase involved in cell wall biosynthesis
LPAVRILLWHGYLLTGSGSNVYTANLARHWRDAGHSVLVMCQDRSASSYPFVDRYAEMPGEWTTAVDPAPGSCVVIRPDIGAVLPVYVYDDYEGFTVKTFPDLSDSELELYTDNNVRAMAEVIDFFRPDAIVTGHEVMGPEIARQACATTKSRYVAKLHGSALEYAVKVQERYRELAARGLGGAAAVVGGSNYMVNEAASIIPGWGDRAVVINPGCDVELFHPRQVETTGPFHLGFVGKLIASKGVHDLIAAASLVDRGPLELTIVGYGGFAEGLRQLATALSGGDLDAARAIAERGGGEPLDALASVLNSDLAAAVVDGFRDVDVRFTGRLEHDALSEVLPDWDCLAAPSVVPEAFGMVAAEAAACGVLPVVPDHSGIGEAAQAIEDAIEHPGLLRFDPADPIVSLTAAIRRVVDLGPERRRDLGRAAARLARQRWSWDEVARKLLEVAVSGPGSVSNSG